jgi:hypothetical protein
VPHICRAMFSAPPHAKNSRTHWAASIGPGEGAA